MIGIVLFQLKRERVAAAAHAALAQRARDPRAPSFEDDMLRRIAGAAMREVEPGHEPNPSIVTLLLGLQELGGELSYARLRKRTGLPMSVLLRGIAALEAVGLVIVTAQEDGRGRARLSEEGRALLDEAQARPHAE